MNTSLNLLMEIDKQYQQATKAELQGVDGVNIINYKSTAINCTSVVSSRVLELEEAAVRCRLITPQLMVLQSTMMVRPAGHLNPVVTRNG